MSLATTRRTLATEVLRLRRNRGLMAFALLLSVGFVVLYFGYGALQHASDPLHRGPAGGTFDFEWVVRMLGLYFEGLVAMLIGTKAGTADLASGVFRDLVGAGRSRWALFAVRAPAAVAVTLALNALAFVVALAPTYLLAGGQSTTSLSLVLQSAGWIALANAIMASLATGIGSLTGSRSVTLTGVIGWQLVATQVLLNVSSLGSVRDGLLTASLRRLMPVPGGSFGLHMATVTAVAVLAGWLAVPAAAGAWRTWTRDA